MLHNVTLPETTHLLNLSIASHGNAKIKSLLSFHHMFRTLVT